MGSNWRSLASARELQAMGYIRAENGTLLDNRDGFFDDHPDSFIRTYDCRIYIAIKKIELDRLRQIIEMAASRGLL